MQSLFMEHGITDPDAMDLWTALISGLTGQQLANDPGGTRWARLVDRAVDMFLAAVVAAEEESDRSHRQENLCRHSTTTP